MTSNKWWGVCSFVHGRKQHVKRELAMRSLFEDDAVEAVLLVNASNAFNSLNREAAL